MASSASTPCLCSLECSLSDYVIVEEASQIRVPPATESKATGNSSPLSLVRQAVMHVPTLMLRTSQCCKAGGWTEFPDNNDPEHSIHAHTIFLELREKIQENRLSLSPPVTALHLRGYKHQPDTTDTPYSQYYYLRIEAGENFYLYVKVGLTTENYTRIQLLRLSSKEGRVLSPKN